MLGDGRRRDYSTLGFIRIAFLRPEARPDTWERMVEGDRTVAKIPNKEE
jgi:hypothetical protein